MEDVEALFCNSKVSVSIEEKYKINVESMVRAIDAMARLNNQSIFVVDVHKNKLIYKSERLLCIDEATDKDKKRDCENPYLELVSNETLEKLVLIREKYLWLNKKLCNNHFVNNICIVDYPILLRKHEFFITQKFTPITSGIDGIPQVGIITTCHSNKTEFECVVLNPSGENYVFDFNKCQFTECNLSVALTCVEKAILQRARKGMATKEIAESLCISVNTVKTHRNRIFKKLHVNNISEALAVLSNYNLE